MAKTKVPITSAGIDFAVMFTPPSGEEDVFVMKIIDPSKNIFSAVKVSDKSVYNFKSTDQVVVLDDVPGVPAPAVGPILLALK